MSLASAIRATPQHPLRAPGTIQRDTISPEAKTMKSNLSRRRFMQTSASAAFVGGIVNFAWAQEQKPAESKSPGEAVNVGMIGANGQARANIEAVSKAGANVVALCDVDSARLAAGSKGFEQAKQY